MSTTPQHPSSMLLVSMEYLRMSKRVRAAIYPRVSDPNLKDSGTLEGQTVALKKYCEEQSYFLDERCIYPEAETAYLKPFRERDQLMKMLDDARRGMFDVVVITEYSRLARRQEEQMLIVYMFKE